MRRIDNRLYNNYEHWLAELSEFNDSKGKNIVGIDDALRAHYLLCDFFLYEGEQIASPGPRDKTLFLSALDRQTVGFGRGNKWQDIFHVSATLFYGMVKNHPFHDGNKRTALLLALYQLWEGGRVADESQKKFELLAVRTAANELAKYPQYRQYEKRGDVEVRTIAHILRKGTRRENKRYRRLTFRDFGTVLSKYGFSFEGPDGNKINITTRETTKVGLFRKREETKTKTVIQIGCPKMTAQINPKAQKEVLKACGLTADNGFDSDVIFGKADPLDSLIAEFQEPLRRLKDK